MTAYYNENDPWAAELLRNLIAAGHIAPGDVDERSIEDVQPDDLKGYIQCHFFAGAGVWSHALRMAGWPDDIPVWTGSCPCQPFSTAGKGNGFADERHLWPAFCHLIEQCGPAIVYGEQVASQDGLAWIDLVQTDMENQDYAFAAFDLCAAGFGAPHIRQRLYWLAYANGIAGRQGSADARGRDQGSLAQARPGPGGDHGAGVMVHGERAGLEGHAGDGDGATRWPDADRSIAAPGVAGGVANIDTDRCTPATIGKLHDCKHHVESCGGAGGVADIIGNGRRTRRDDDAGDDRNVTDTNRIAGGMANTIDGQLPQTGSRSIRRIGQPGTGEESGRPGPVNGVWRNADWLLCRDHKWRPVEPGTFPLAHGAASRVGRLRAYGNAIVAAQAQEFIGASLGAIEDLPMRLSGDALRQDETRLRA